MGDGKSERCLTLAELELDMCWDWHPCSSSPLPFYGPASNTTSHGHMHMLVGSTCNEEILFSCQDPHLIAEIPSNPRLIPYCSPNSIPTILQDSDTMLTKPLNSKHPLRPPIHYNCSPNSRQPWKTPITFLSSFVFIILF